ncbi:hypothetical protein E2C01_075049 [Portunus trituberculatus]|uniref:Uncharacterized protein n=1 Tax=Portunus trituberculatus TaxID=210409 RepID=A0A5B7IF49_PORTR|nr:hypothetical protein [Portunus trituberculatus]
MLHSLVIPHLFSQYPGQPHNTHSTHHSTHFTPTQIIILLHSFANPLHTTALTTYTHLASCHATATQVHGILSTRPQPNSKHLPHNTRSAAPLSR